MNEYQIGDRVRLLSLHKPTGTITDITEGTKLKGAMLVIPRYVIRWDDGEPGEVSGHDIEPVTELQEPEPNSIWPWICDICGEPIFSDDERHDYHEPECPNYGRSGDNVVECACDGAAHAECCPECAAKPLPFYSADELDALDAFVDHMLDCFKKGGNQDALAENTTQQ